MIRCRYMQGRLCFTTCAVTSGQRPFSLSVARDRLPNTFVSQGISTDCNNDFLVIPGGFDPTNPNPNPPVNDMAFDRFCGERLNPQPLVEASVTVCSKFLLCVIIQSLFLLMGYLFYFYLLIASVTPFRISYRTNGDETTAPTTDTAGNGNRGFCLNFQQ